jgi:hypothetical protein
MYKVADESALDRDGQISRFSYGEFAIVEATDSQSMFYRFLVLLIADNVQCSRTQRKHPLSNGDHRESLLAQLGPDPLKQVDQVSIPNNQQHRSIQQLQ